MPKTKFLRLTLIEWVICGVACIGFAFDTYELLVLTLTVQPALSEFLVSKPGSPNFNHWIGVMFYIPAIAGGIFGLLGGYFIDRFGRRRILFWSILLFCFSALATAGSSTAQQLLFYRCVTFVGVSVEFVAATAWLAELFPERKLRETVLGHHADFFLGRRHPDGRGELSEPQHRPLSSGHSRRA